MQKDTDARWTKKNDETHYGYKDHVKVDADSKIITDYATTSANVHDSNEFTEFLNEEDKVVYADSAYVGKDIPVLYPVVFIAAVALTGRIHKGGINDRSGMRDDTIRCYI